MYPGSDKIHGAHAPPNAHIKFKFSVFFLAYNKHQFVVVVVVVVVLGGGLASLQTTEQLATATRQEIPAHKLAMCEHVTGNWTISSVTQESCCGYKGGLQCCLKW